MLRNRNSEIEMSEIADFMVLHLMLFDEFFSSSLLFSASCKNFFK